MSFIVKREDLIDMIKSTEYLTVEDAGIEFFFPTDCEHDYIYEIWVKKHKEDSNSSVISRVYKFNEH